MGGRMLIKLLNFLRMAGFTSCFYFALKDYFQWLMRILMTTEAMGKFKVRLAFMTL